jgi:hypothetical protein
MYNDELGIARKQSDLDFYYPKEASLTQTFAMKLLKTCSSTVTFAAQSPPVYGAMREVPHLALERGSKGPNVEVCFFSSLDEESTFEVQCVNLSNFFERDSRPDFDVCGLQIHSTLRSVRNSAVVSLLARGVALMSSISDIRENLIHKRMQIVKPPNAERFAKYPLALGFRIYKRVNFKLDQNVESSAIATLSSNADRKLLISAARRG